MTLNQQLANMIVNFVFRRISQPDGPVVSLDRRYRDLMLLQWAYQFSFDDAVAESIRTIDSMTDRQRFNLFCRGYAEAPRAPAEEQDGGFQFARRWTHILATSEPQIFAADIDLAWQRLRARLVGGLRKSNYLYAPATDLPLPDEDEA